MSTGLEIYYHPLCPFFSSVSSPIKWRRSESEGRMNILFDKKEVVAELTPLYPIHAISFLRIVNRTNKNILRLDISGVQHDNPTVISLDGLNIHNQEGDPDETYNSPPYGMAILFPTIEKYRKIHYDQYGQSDVSSEPYSFVGFPVTDAASARKIRIWYQNHRVGDFVSSTGQAIDIADMMPSYGNWVKRLFISPDQDYPDGDLFANFDFNGAQVGNSWGLQQPSGWSLEGYTYASDSNPSFVPHVITFNGQKVVYIRAGYWKDNHAVVNEGLWNMVGIFQNFKMTPSWKRDAGNQSRCRIGMSQISTTVIDSSFISNINVVLSQDYFWNKVYDISGVTDKNSWETDRGSEESLWFTYEQSYLSTAWAGSKVRHTLLDPVNFVGAKQYPGKFHYRFREYGTDNKNTANTSAWKTGEISIPQDNPIVLTQSLSSEVLVDPLGSIPVFQVGQIGGRGNSIKFSFNISGYYSAAIIQLLDSNFSNRKIYIGDIFHFEYLIDSISSDYGVYSDLQISDQDGTNSIWLSSVVSKMYPQSTMDEWVKKDIDLSPWADKYIRKIAIRYTPIVRKNSGGVVAYFQGLQIINNSNRFLGKQFMISARVYTANLVNVNSEYANSNKPQIRFYLKKQDQLGNIYWFLLNMNLVGEFADKNGFYWIKAIVQIESDDNAIELGVACGISKRIPNSVIPGGQGPQDNGGYMMIERFSMEPLSKLHLVSTYSTDNATSESDPMDDFHLIKPKSFGYKAWATQAFGKYFEEWSE